MDGVRRADVVRSRRASEIPTDRCEAFAITDEYPVADHPLSGGPSCWSKASFVP